MDFETQLAKYAQLTLRFGVNIQKGQTLVISSSIENADFVRLTVKRAYEMGARKVHVYWTDDETTLIELQHAKEDSLTEVPQWIPDSLAALADAKAAFLTVSSTSPFKYREVIPERMNSYRQARSRAYHEFHEKHMSRQWCIVGVPSPEWAQVVFPEVPVEQAVRQLWDRIFYTVRLTEDDPVEAWNRHLTLLDSKLAELNARHFKRLHYTAPGTKLTVELPSQHLWATASKVTDDGVSCCVNMPTEEVFTSPAKFGVDGVVRNTKPLNYGGNIIDGFQLTFKDGRVVDFSADTGAELLRGILDTDQGARHLGEIALVPHHSPISDLNFLFYNTLFDENASCHIALGDGLSMCIEDGFSLTEDEREAKGVNKSMTHVDFMVGSDQLDIDGELEDGTLHPIFRQGNWAF